MENSLNSARICEYKNPEKCDLSVEGKIYVLECLKKML